MPRAAPDCITIVAQRDRRHYHVCDMSVMPTDASVYLHPPRGGEYRWGREMFAQDETSITFDTAANSTTDRPKISIHQSGQVHVKDPDGQYLAGPVWIPSLPALGFGQVGHIAVDDLGSLPQFLVGGMPPNRFRVNLTDRAESLLFNVFVGTNDPRVWPVRQMAQVTMSRPRLADPLHVGIELDESAPQRTADTPPSVTILIGWDPSLPGGSPQNVLYVRTIL
jgi:hypothetical protein